jgi:hypothetical protein
MIVNDELWRVLKETVHTQNRTRNLQNTKQKC